MFWFTESTKPTGRTHTLLEQQETDEIDNDLLIQQHVRGQTVSQKDNRMLLWDVKI